MSCKCKDALPCRRERGPVSLRRTLFNYIILFYSFHEGGKKDEMDNR